MNPVNKFASNGNAFELLRRFAPRKFEGEQCDLCSLRLGEIHQHLLELTHRKIVCACDACAVLFGSQGETKYKRVPRKAKLLREFQLEDSEWESLRIPIGLAFFFENSVAKKVVAFYPSPAGATESLLELASWEDVVTANPVLKKMQPDVEALLVNRIGDKPEYYLAPIDECYKLVGLIRTNWRGLSGGTEVWKVIEEFFRTLRNEPAQV